jgi:hypothetical protein
VNNKDRKLLARIRTILDSVPRALDGGSIQGSITGFAGYSRDMSFLQGEISKVFYEISFPDPDLSKEEMADNIELMLLQCEKFIEFRKSLNWDIKTAGKISNIYTISN